MQIKQLEEYWPLVVAEGITTTWSRCKEQRRSGKPRLLPCEAPTCSQQVHKRYSDEAIYVEDQVGFLGWETKPRSDMQQR